MGEKAFDEETRLYGVKKGLDRLLPLILLLVVFYLYLDLVASSQNFFYSYKAYLQYSILAYFVIDIAVLFTMYEENREFFKNHWFDILLTVPFLAAFKGLKGLKIIKMGKGGKLLKPGKALKGVKLGQKLGKLVKKGRKLMSKNLS